MVRSHYSVAFFERIYISVADLVHVPSTTDLKYQFILTRYLIFQFYIVLNSLYSKSLWYKLNLSAKEKIWFFVWMTSVISFIKYLRSSIQNDTVRIFYSTNVCSWEKAHDTWNILYIYIYIHTYVTSLLATNWIFWK